ncbi:unnamed protein product, partial [marine sediment metagenome]
MLEIRKTCEQAARLGGQILLDMQQSINPREKAPRDLVTEADLASQNAIHDCLTKAYPDFHFIGEEATEQENSANCSDFCWVVDPLDGTTNYVHGLDNYCVSIALVHQHRSVVGVIYDPVRQDLFTSIRGEGAFRNEKRLETSQVTKLDAALIAASFSARVAKDSAEIKRFVSALGHCQALRRMGSAALNLCYVAAGSLDGYWATSVKKWDVAAGLLMVEEAGGTTTAIDGGPFDLEDPKFITTSTPDL